MPLSTPQVYGASNSQAGGATAPVWNTPGLVHGATEPSDDSADTTIDAVAAPPSKVLVIAGFKLLAEDGGTIPNVPGLVIVRVRAVYRCRVRNTTGAIDDYRGMMTAEVGTTTVNKMTQNLLGGTAAKTDSGYITTTLDTGGTVVSPQTLFTRAELATTAFRARGTAAKFAGAVGGSTIFWAWVGIIVDYAYVVSKVGGGLRSGVGGGLDVVGRAAAGGAVSPSVAGGPKVAVTARAGGSSSPRAAGGPKIAVVVGVGGAIAVRRGGGGRVVGVTGAGGGGTGRVAGGLKQAVVRRNGGGMLVGAAGGADAAVTIKAGGGSVSGPAGGGTRKTATIKTAGASFDLRAGGPGRVQKDVAGGGLLVGVGGLLQYSVYTFAIAGFSRHGGGAIAAASKMGLFALRDGGATYEFKATMISDAVTGYYAFRTPSPAADPTMYWVAMHRAGTTPIFGRSDEDLVPVASLVQGRE